MGKAKIALAKALELDDTLADAHVSLANLKIFERDWSAAEKEFQRAIELNPSHANAHFMYADYLISRLRNQDWEREIHRALELDPMSYFIQAFYGWHLVYLGRYDEAILQIQKVVATSPAFPSLTWVCGPLSTRREWTRKQCERQGDSFLHWAIKKWCGPCKTVTGRPAIVGP